MTKAQSCCHLDILAGWMNEWIHVFIILYCASQTRAFRGDSSRINDFWVFVQTSGKTVMNCAVGRVIIINSWLLLVELRTPSSTSWDWWCCGWRMTQDQKWDQFCDGVMTSGLTWLHRDAWSSKLNVKVNVSCSTLASMTRYGCKAWTEQNNIPCSYSMPVNTVVRLVETKSATCVRYNYISRSHVYVLALSAWCTMRSWH